MSSSRAHRNSVVQSCSHSCYSRGWWPPKIKNAEREGSSLHSVSQCPDGPRPGNKVQYGSSSSGTRAAPLLNLPCRVTVTAPQNLRMSLVLASWVFLNVPRETQRGYLRTSEGISLQVGQNLFRKKFIVRHTAVGITHVPWSLLFLILYLSSVVFLKVCWQKFTSGAFGT